MKNNLKTKVMLALLAGGMLCANGALAAEGDIWWYGKTSGFVDIKPDPAVTTGVNLTIIDSTEVNGKTVADVNKEIYGGYTSGSEDVKNNSITFNTTNAAMTAANIYGADTDSGDASGNSVNIKNGIFSGEIYGSKIHNISTTGIATKNSVNIADGTFSGKIFGGFNFGSTATKNSVVIDGGTFSGGIYGAQGKSVEGNLVTINNGVFDGNNQYVYGGNATGGVATDNIVTINNGVFDGNNKYVYGGVGNGGDVTGNKVIINDGQFTGTNIWAGKAMGTPCGNATGNTVTIKGGTFNNTTIYGSISGNGNATGNTVNIEGGTFNNIKKLYGGYVAATCTSSNNTLNLKTKLGGTSTEVGYFQTMNFTLPSDIADGDVVLNTGALKVDGTDGTAIINVYGDEVELFEGNIITLVQSDSMTGDYNVGKIFGVDATGSSGVYSTDIAKITISSNSVTLTMLTGYIASDSWYGTGTGAFVRKKVDAVPTGGKLNIAGTEESFAETKHFYGGYSKDDGVEVKENTVTVTGGTFGSRSEIYGGYSLKGNATENTVTIEGDILADGTMLYGGYSESGAVAGNSVTIDKGTFGSKIHGGSSNSGNAESNSITINGGTFGNGIYGGYSNRGNVESNSVTITDGTIKEHVFGGYTDGSGNVIGNTVTISGGTFEGNGHYYAGGYSGGGNATDNTVTIIGGNFTDNYKLYGGYTTSGTSTNNTLNLKMKMSGKVSEVKYFQNMNFTLPSNITSGDTMLNTGALAVNGDKGGTATVNVYAAEGVTLKKDDIITLVNVAAGDVLYGTFNAGEILDGAADFYFEDGEDKNGDEDGNDLVIVLNKDFGATGDDAAIIKAVAEGIAASLAFVNQGADMVATSGIDGLYVADSENPTIAAFSGNKTRYNTGSHVDIHGWNALAGVALNNKASFSHGVFVEIGNGDIDTYAALNGSGSSDYKGGGYMLRKDMGKGWTIDGAVRAGRVETSWGNDTKGGYEAKQTYYGAHVTFNKMLKEYGEQKLNGYLRYTFTHLGSDSVNLDGTHYGFDSVNSHRTRLGARMVDEGQNGFELYYGAAWEYGFGGDCDATVKGVTTSGPAVDGSNGVFEVGGTWSDNKWEISAGLEGYAGAKRGVAGGMNFIYKF